MECIMAVDVGTQSVKAGIIDTGMNILERRQIPVSACVRNGNWVEMDAEAIWRALAEACSGLRLGKEAAGVVFSTLCPSFITISADGEPLHPVIIHQDRRSRVQAAAAIEAVGEEAFLGISGNLPVPGGISVTSLLWVKDNLPDIYRRKDIFFGHIGTFLVNKLCGAKVMDPSNASFAGLYDTVGYGNWHKDLYGPLEIDPRQLPRIIMSASVAGEAGDRAAAELGLKRGVPVIHGANDTVCAAVGAGVTKAGDMMNTSGTVDILTVCLDKPIVSRQHLLRTHALPGRWLAMRTVGAGGGSLEWFRQNFYRELPSEEFYSAYLPGLLQAAAEPDEKFLPFLTGDRHSLTEKKASFLNLTLETSREELLVALLNGVTDFQFEILSDWEKEVALSKTIYHVGGGAKSAYTAYKQKRLKGYRLEQLGETTLTGAAQLGFNALNLKY